MSARLFEPLKLGPVTLRNRTIRAAAFEGMAPGHQVSDALVAYHRAVSEGGVGMSTVAYAAVERSGLSFAHQLWMRDEALPGLRRLTDAIHAGGAAASIQLGHCGNMAQPRVIGERPIAPSARFNLYGPTYPRAMRVDDMARVRDSFVRAVRLAHEAGFDAVEVHAGHGYLLSQFLSPYTNHRGDRYGGSFEARLRYPLEVLAAVRDATRGRVAMLVKTNLRDGFDGGMQLDEGVEAARAFARLGVDALVLSGGFVSRAPMYIMRGAMPTRAMAHFMTDPLLKHALPIVGQRMIPPLPYRENYFLDDARVARRAVPIPLVYVGGVSTYESARAVLDEGFEGIAMARALIEDPAFVDRMAREEATARSRCDHCNFCAARIYTGPMSCPLREPLEPRVQALLAPRAGAR